MNEISIASREILGRESVVRLGENSDSQHRQDALEMALLGMAGFDGLAKSYAFRVPVELRVEAVVRSLEFRKDYVTLSMNAEQSFG